ncbi:hypothetical protein [Mucilaginibacter sp. BT774]|uniref:hypothetical protein n=1 Tax=Mucilaginibacter sp. BT774 TaxID=3062276 RepID=UPI002674B792|nr:hypothetical protein [Mucilaginibacter sp. BT774]MDO3627628.1 hypothetical protein [Mucilaginibacter sp. BT774]
MEQKEIHYQFVNSETGNVLAYLSLPANIGDEERQAKLEEKRDELAIAHGLYTELIYWQDQDHPSQ